MAGKKKDDSEKPTTYKVGDQIEAIYEGNYQLLITFSKTLSVF